MLHRRLRVALVVIARDEAATLPGLLGSVAAVWFDSIVVGVDDRTTDETASIAVAAGARVVPFVWADSFAAARNAALDHASGDYAMWLDADEHLEPGQTVKLRALLDELRPDREFAHAFRQVSVIEGIAWTVVSVRLFPLRPDVRWCYRVHEQLTPALAVAGVPVHDSEIVIRHAGFEDPAVYEAKRRRNVELARRDLVEHPDDPHVRETARRFGLIPFQAERLPHAAGMSLAWRSVSASAHPGGHGRRRRGGARGASRGNPPG
jgi:glycosyltransferase involved in cell wall biosynthesis